MELHAVVPQSLPQAFEIEEVIVAAKKQGSRLFPRWTSCAGMPARYIRGLRGMTSSLCRCCWRGLA